jgi:hypothetical protein
LVRDFLVPLLIYGKEVNDLDFKDIDIWFAKSEDADQLIESLKSDQGMVKLIPQPSNDIAPIDDYGCGQLFTRKKFYFCLVNQPLFMVDIMVAEQIPVNDFSVNLLMFKPKQRNFEGVNLSWFPVGNNPDGESYRYSTLMLLEMIANHQTDFLAGYQLLSKETGKDNRVMIFQRRCKEMSDRGWLMSIPNEFYH